MSEPDLPTATHRLVRTVDGLGDDAWSGPSLLPGWTRAHVVAHLTLNAEALAACIEGATGGTPTPMYADESARDDDIADLAGTDPTELRERLLGSTTRMTEALTTLAQHRADLLDTEVERTPGGRRFRLADVASMRLREVEIHHADLDAGYTPADWEPAFSALLVEAMAARPSELAATLAPTDDPRRWTLGSGGPVVSGPLHALAWWATGRPAGPDLTSDDGTLPRMEAW